MEQLINDLIESFITYDRIWIRYICYTNMSIAVRIAERVNASKGDCIPDNARVTLIPGCFPDAMEQMIPKTIAEIQDRVAEDAHTKELADAAAATSCASDTGRTLIILVPDSDRTYLRRLSAITGRFQFLAFGLDTRPYWFHQSGFGGPAYRQHARRSTEALMMAAARGDGPEVDRLVSRGVDVNALWEEDDRTLPKGSTALMNAVQKGHTEIARKLLAAGARDIM